MPIICLEFRFRCVRPTAAAQCETNNAPKRALSHCWWHAHTVFTYTYASNGWEGVERRVGGCDCWSLHVKIEFQKSIDSSVCKCECACVSVYGRICMRVRSLSTTRSLGEFELQPRPHWRWRKGWTSAVGWCGVVGGGGRRPIIALQPTKLWIVARPADCCCA